MQEFQREENRREEERKKEKKTKAICTPFSSLFLRGSLKSKLNPQCFVVPWT
jgi:hypothetical protein